MSTEDVATALKISPRTVRAHVESILAKLGVHSKLQAVLLGLRSGVIVLKEGEHLSLPGSS
jgi:DNA-binding CsgD family transcriptional regulator